MSGATFLVGDVFERLAELPDDSIDLVLTSPPFLALRSYLPDDHPDKAKEIGSEPTPAEFLDTLLRLTAEWERVLAPHGSIAVELGDTYAGSGGGGGDYLPGGMREGQQQFAGSASTMRESNAAHWRQKNKQRDAWPLDKSMCGIPHLYHLSLAYGRNLLTGEESPAGMWRVRNVVAWCRPNPPVGALGDKYRPATSYITIATRARDRWFDLDAVRNQASGPVRMQRVGEASASKGVSGGDSGNPDKERASHNPAGSPPLDWWEVPTEPYKGSHYATWPRRLLTRPIESMCPREVCTACGEPRRRIVAADPDAEKRMISAATEDAERSRINEDQANRGGRKQEPRDRAGDRTVSRSVVTTGWSECGCEAPRRPGIVLDPFAGSGTTLAVATGLGRDAIGIDLDERNADLARERVGMFLTVIAPGEVAA